ncbi:hypothetical protein LWI28_002864 [Acer negundo]|uniref:Cytochrome P450 n=1 Tax=Acer negundo TaxID=4023 RepID=A0AAD5IBW1_ACENE|nr:hypothetical protein LWI28_002864 [Acer negundo]
MGAEIAKKKSKHEALEDLESKFEQTPDYHTPSKHISCSKGENEDGNGELKIDHGGRVRKHLTFEEDKIPSKNPSTPCTARTSSLSVIDICDSDDENVQPPSVDKQGSVDNKASSKSILFQHSCGESMNDCNGEIPVIPTAKRKRASNIVTSDSENDEDDNVPICKLKRLHLQERISGQASPELKICSGTGIPPRDDDIANLVTPTRRRLVSLRKREGQRRARKGSSSKATTENVEDDESKEAGSESEGESLNGFIVDSMDVEDDDESSDAQDESYDNEDFGEILSRIKRSKGQNLSWEFEADMLAAFASMYFFLCLVDVFKDVGQVVNETHRVANIISGVFRRAMTDINIKGYTIPKGWKSNSWATTSPGNVFTSFGGGPRLCPGYELARVEFSVFLHHLITRFRSK